MRHKAQISQMFTIVWDNHREYFTLIKVSSLLVFGRITFCHLPFQSKWLYVGTERGNIHMVNVESFTLSGYVIMWNKAIELWVSRHRELQWFSCVFFYCWVWEILIKGLVYKYYTRSSWMISAYHPRNIFLSSTVPQRLTLDLWFISAITLWTKGKYEILTLWIKYIP